MNSQIVEVALRVVFVASLLHNFLPPWDFLDDFPSAKRWYKLMIYMVGYVALNGRSTVYKTLSVNNPDGVNSNGKTNGGPK